jgi:cytochrome c-type biogenesis protein CcmH/NrfG
MNAPTDWVSALAILAAGLVLGLIVFVASRKRKVSAVNKRAELEARRDALVEQLRDLGDDVADGEKEWIERETADVLRALDRMPEPKLVDVPAEPRPGRRPLVLGFVYGVVCTLVAGGVIYYGSTYATKRGDSTGTLDERIARAKDAFARNDLMATFEETKAILEETPEEPRALTYNAIVRLAMGEVEPARKQLEQATQLDPKLLDAWVALASARTQSGDAAGAAAAIESAIQQHPDEEQRLREVFAQIQSQKPIQKTSNPDMPPGHPPIPDAAPEQAAGNPSQPIRITLSLDDPKHANGGVIYVMARGEKGGHPVAVKRIETNAFPLSVDFGGADTMMGEPLPATVRLEARLDLDGDAGTNEATDPRAVVEGVHAGTAVEMKLARTN